MKTVCLRKADFFCFLLSCLIICIPQEQISVGVQMESDPGMVSTLRITITGVKEQQGVLKVCVADNPAGFLKECFQEHSVMVSGESVMVVEFHRIPFGQYAISLFHDVNQNQELDRRKVFGIPSEPFGFSNNPALLFGAPNFEQCAFSVDQNITEVVIKLRRY
jgi:uncharacterized protein (DUF2141 family)